MPVTSAKSPRSSMESECETSPPPEQSPEPSSPVEKSVAELDLLRLTRHNLLSVKVPSKQAYSLYSGSCFKGTQKSGRSSYHVSVQLQVNLCLVTIALCVLIGHFHV
jgi:hypothetical protein